MPPHLGVICLMAPTKASDKVYQLKITLMGCKPPIWRRILVPGSMTLCCLHSAIQEVMGWSDTHLHEFEKDGNLWGPADSQSFEELGHRDESQMRLDQLLRFVKNSCQYIYDFGDYWRHKIVVEKILPANGLIKPSCIAGKRHCPIEDIGGPGGYADFLDDSTYDPDLEEHEHARELRETFVDVFDIDAANSELARMEWPVQHFRH